MEEEKYTVDDQDEITEVESNDSDEEDVSDESDDTSEDDSEDEENSTQLQEKLRKLEKENAKFKRLLGKKTEKVSDEDGETTKSKTTPKSDDEYVTKRELEMMRLESKGYDGDQVELIMKLGGISALKDESVKKAIDAIKAEKDQIKAQAETKSTSKSSRSYSADDLRAMPTDKLEKLIREGKVKGF